MAAKLYAVPGLKNGAATQEGLPTTLKVLNWGKNKTTKGIFTVDERTMKAFDETQAQMGWDKIALDYEHNTVPGSSTYKASEEPRPVAAHLSCKVVPYEGLFCTVHDWTPGPTGGQLNAKNYADLSASPLAVKCGDENVVIGCHSVALTQHGATQGLEFLTSDFGAGFEAKLNTLSATFNEVYLMNNPHIAALRTLLGMADTDSDESVLSAMADKIKKKELSCGTRSGPLDNAGGTTPKVEGLSADAVAKIVADAIKPLAANVTALSTASETAAKNAELNERNALVSEFAKQGKVCPLSADSVPLTPIAVIKELLANTPKSNLATKKAPGVNVKPGANGRIHGNPGVVTLSVNGVPVSIGGTGNVQPQRMIDSTRSNFQEQFDALQRK